MEKVKKTFAVKRSFFALIACMLLASICFSMLVSCTDSESTEGSAAENASSAEPSGEQAVYTVSVQSIGGTAMSELDVYIYDGADLSNMKDFAKTNADGEVTFNLSKGGNYAIVIPNAPKGYEVQANYTFDGVNANVVLNTSIVTDEELSSATIGLGDVMYDFTIMTPAGDEITLSEVLQEKKMVMLNFWYTTCTWCLEEFPIMEEVYQEYKDDIAIIAVNPLEDNTAVEAFQAQHGLTFPMAACPSAWSNTFGVSGYPTSVFIDRYGVVCLIESGAITSKRPFVSAFEHFISDEYEQTLCVNGIGDLVAQITPTYTMDTSEAIGNLINNGDIDVTYRPETDDESAELSWPFIAGEKFDRNAIYASNKGIDDSFAIIYADVTLKAGQAVGFDYFSSSESLCDILYVIVNNDDVFQISGISQTEEWKSCYPCVAEEDGTYEVALCYIKDSDGSEGEDTVYISNMRVVDVDDIDVATYLPRYVANSSDGTTYTYSDIVFNEKDGYYHVGTENGPLLLADLMGYTQFNEEQSVYEIVYEGNADKDGVSLYDKENGLGMVNYFSYASNSQINGICTVNQELADMLKQVAEVAGFDGDENEWLKVCLYYEAYGDNVAQLQDPIKGLTTFSAFETKLGKDIDTNYFYYDRAIIPRGLFSKFVPSKSGVYRFTSKSDYEEGIEAWIFDENGEIIYTYAHDERMYTDPINCSMVYYMEAGKSYFINMAFWDVYATGSIYYDVEYIGSSIELFRAASPGYFTYDTDATGELLYDIIADGIDPELKDGKYYVSGEDSLLYADFTNAAGVFSQSIIEMIDMGGFDFSKSETDDEILVHLKNNDNDVEKTEEYLKKLWGEDYDANAEAYQIEDVFEGRYHGVGEDCTEEIRAYIEQIDKSSSTERNGCVVVDERLAEILQMLMDKFTFEGVENSWTKVCYYYDYLGPEN